MKRFLIRTGQTAAQLTNGRQGWIGTSGREPPFYFNNESLVLAVYRLSMTESGKITEAANVPRAGPFNARVARLCTRRPPTLIFTPERMFAHRDFLDNALVER